jgi:hypothetical protein
MATRSQVRWQLGRRPVGREKPLHSRATLCMKRSCRLDCRARHPCCSTGWPRVWVARALAVCPAHAEPAPECLRGCTRNLGCATEMLQAWHVVCARSAAAAAIGVAPPRVTGVADGRRRAGRARGRRGRSRRRRQGRARRWRPVAVNGRLGADRCRPLAPLNEQTDRRNPVPGGAASNQGVGVLASSTGCVSRPPFSVA